MGVFNAVGGVGLVLALSGLAAGRALDRRPRSGRGHVPAVAVVLAGGTFLAGLGFGAALLRSTAGASIAVATISGLAIGLAIAGGAFALATAVDHDPGQDSSPGAGPRVGSIARVTSSIPEGGVGEVSLVTGDEGLKVPARSDTMISQGTSVVVIDITDAAVVVAEAGF